MKKLLLFLFILVGCKSINKTTVEYKNVEYKYAMKFNKSNIGFAKTKLKAEVTDLLAGYVFGINFKLNNNLVTTSINGNITLVNNKFKIEIKEINKNHYMIETGIYNYQTLRIQNYNKKYTANITKDGSDFKKTYNKTVSEAIKKAAKNGDSGIIVPLGNLNVVLNNNGNIKISEKFEVYIF